MSGVTRRKKDPKFLSDGLFGIYFLFCGGTGFGRRNGLRISCFLSGTVGFPTSSRVFQTKPVNISFGSYSVSEATRARLPLCVSVVDFPPLKSCPRDVENVVFRNQAGPEWIWAHIRGVQRRIGSISCSPAKVLITKGPKDMATPGADWALSGTHFATTSSPFDMFLSRGCTGDL